MEFFYSNLKPWIHYIPVAANANQQMIEELIQFAIERDDLSQEIADNGYNLIWNHLNLNDVECYWEKLLKEYSKLLNYKPVLQKELIEIKKR